MERDNLNSVFLRSFFIFIFCLTVSNFGFSQEQHVTFPSPNAYSLVNYTPSTVNYYTGIPDIRIPLYTVDSKELHASIDLSYFAGGVKVNEFPNWVGSGWSLNVGGVITRAIGGINDDDESIGFYYTGHLLKDNWPNPSDDYIESQRVGLVDGMPDMFYYNFHGKSGKFFFDNDGGIRTLPYANIKIELVDKGSIFKNFGSVIFRSSGFKKWKITDENGVIYYFEELELSKSESATFTQEGGSGDVKDIITSWYLTKIVSPNLKDEILFEYDYSNFDTSSSLYEYQSTAIGYYTHHGSNIFLGNGSLTNMGGFPENRGQTISRNYRHNLKRIIFERGTVEFFTSVRNDLPHPAMQYSFSSFKLDSILLKNNQNEIIRRFSFEFIDKPNQRLTLKKLIVDKDQVYSFEYNNMHLLPRYSSRDTDHWGYFNGAGNIGTGLIPTFSFSSQTFQDKTYPGINKDPDIEKMKYGVLNKITWPTGGSRQFFYEPNDYSFINNQPLAEDGWSAWNYIDSSIASSVTLNPLAQVQLWYECSTDGVAYGNNIEPCLSVLTPWNFNFSGTFDLTKYRPQYTGEIDVKVKLKYRLLEEGSITKKIGGGIRIAEIHDVDQFNPPIKRKFEYTQEGNSELSSGVAGSDLKYHAPFTSGSQGSDIFATGVKVFSHSAFPLSMTQSRPIGYQRVVEKIDGNGETIHKFTSFYDYPDQIGLQNNPYEMPLVIKKSYDYKRGKLIAKTQADNFGNVVESKRVLGYKTLKSGSPVKVWQSFPLIKFILQFQNNGSMPPFLPVTLRETTAFSIESESFKPAYEMDKLYSGEAELAVDRSYQYNAFHQLHRRTVVNSNWGFESEEYKYPLEYEKPSQEINALLSKNIIGDPIESIKSVKNGVISGQARKWKIKSGEVLLDEILHLETKAPIKNFPHSVDGISFHDSFVKKTKLGYDHAFNINQVEELGQNKRAILWDSTDKLPVCEVLNSRPDQISYTSFETQEKGGWTYMGNSVSSIGSRTGGRYYDLGTGSISKSGIEASSSEKYLLTFWVKRANGSANWEFMGQTEELDNKWKLIQRIVTENRLSIEGNGLHLDELRLHPIDAGMTTYTYDPLVGLTSKTDARNYTLHYEYDYQGRLKAIRDDQGQLKELYEYNYQTSGLNP
jgi:YD repeat-containing protein